MYIDKALMKKLREKAISELKPCEVGIDDKFMTGRPKRIYFRLCYSKALEYIYDLPEDVKDAVKLIHGTLKNNDYNVRYGHAWVEINDSVVFDGVMQRFYDKDCYYNVHSAQKEVEYTVKEAALAVLKHNHKGPWHHD